LTPTKAKSLIHKTAVDLNLSQEMVQDVVDFYWETVIKKMESLKNPSLFLHSLGTIKISRVKLRRDIAGLEKILSGGDHESFKKIIKYNLTHDLLNLKKESLEICNEYYKPIYEKRNKNLEGKRQDIRGDKEQPL